MGSPKISHLESAGIKYKVLPNNTYYSIAILLAK